MIPAAPNSFRLCHVGVAVADLKAAIAFYHQAFGFHVRHGPVDDPRQKVSVCFLGAQNGEEIELIAPLENQSPVARYLSKGVGAYHICYEVPDIETALNRMRQCGCVIVSPPVPAVAFGGRPIAWFLTPTQQLVEILQAPSAE